MFLDHKNVYNTIEGFLFYILCEVKEDGYHFVGYFSKEKSSASINNLSCILVMPFCQRAGYGKLLIEMSYALSMIEERNGGPERPLSDLGHRTYVSYWTRKIVSLLIDLVKKGEGNVTIDQLKDKTGMTPDDILYTLKNHDILLHGNTLNCTQDFLQQILDKSGRPGRALVTENIRWKPYKQQY